MPPQPPADPYVLSMVICDSIYFERHTGKRSLIGLSTAISAWDYPFVHPQLCIHVELTEGYGKTSLLFRIVDVDEDDEPLVESMIEAEFTDPRSVILLAITLEDVKFNYPGEYRIQCYCGQNLLLERRIQAFKTGEQHDRSE